MASLTSEKRISVLVAGSNLLFNTDLVPYYTGCHLSTQLQKAQAGSPDLYLMMRGIPQGPKNLNCIDI